jgi:hypothetical protein
MGSKLFPADKVKEGDWQYVTDKCKEALTYIEAARESLQQYYNYKILTKN